jgi:hypothetical protein
MDKQIFVSLRFQIHNEREQKWEEKQRNCNTEKEKQKETHFLYVNFII